MDLSDFRRHLSALGPDLSAWTDRDDAIELLARCDEAVALLAAASDNARADQDLTEMIVAAVRDHP